MPTNKKIAKKRDAENHALNLKILPQDGMVIGVRIDDEWAWTKTPLTRAELMRPLPEFVGLHMEPCAAAIRQAIFDAS